MKILRKVFAFLCGITLISLILVCGTFLIFYIRLGKDRDVHESLLETGKNTVTKIYYDKNGEEIEWDEERIFAEKTEWIALAEMPEDIKNAFVAIEDKRFYSHHGVDWLRTGKAALNYFFRFDASFGGSTITQQLIKNLTGENKSSPERKFREIVRAIRLERKLGKEGILERYLNVVYMAENCYGIESAAHAYYGKSAAELSLSECASLAAVVQNPYRYDPVIHPQNNDKRRKIVLAEMRKQGYINEERYRNALDEIPEVQENAGENRTVGIYSWYTEALISDVTRDLCAQYGYTPEEAKKQIVSGGLRIYSCVDPDVQTMLEEYYRNLPETSLAEEGIQSACAICDVSGRLVALVGGVGEKNANRIFNRATDAKRPPGSTLKPLAIYAPAIESRLVTWATVFDDIPLTFTATDQRPWPRNSPYGYRGLIPVADAVRDSVNTVSVQVLRKIGVRNVFLFCKNELGLPLVTDDGHGHSDMQEAPLALGQLTYGVSLAEMTNAYTVFPSGGLLGKVRTYDRVEDSRGRTLLENKEPSKRVFSEETAAVTTRLLEDVVRNGTAKNVSVPGVTAIAGKTGTTSSGEDKWFIGYTPEYVCGVWFGYDTPQPFTGSGNPSCKVFSDVMSSIVRLKKIDTKRAFPLPENVVIAEYCADSGAIPTDVCDLDPRGDRKRIGYFIRGTEPDIACRTHIAATIDESDGMIADGETLFTRKIALLDHIRRSFPNSLEIGDDAYLYRNRIRDPFAETA